MQLGSTTFYISCNLDFMLDHFSTINYVELQICVIVVPEYKVIIGCSVLIYFIARILCVQMPRRASVKSSILRYTLGFLLYFFLLVGLRYPPHFNFRKSKLKDTKI